MRRSFPTTVNRPVFLAVAALLAGCILGYVFRGMIEKPHHQHFETRLGGWQFINPLLDCEATGDTAENRELTPFKQKIAGFIRNDLNKKWADKVAVYFRELNDGPWFSIGETGNFHPASLLKVPVMMAVLKQAETDPRALQRKIRYGQKGLETSQNAKEERLILGDSYSVDDLLTRMIVHSDNISTYLLDNYVGLEVLEHTYHVLGLSNPYSRTPESREVIASPDYMISAEQYASFFRILYNASYLSREMSDKALQLLSTSDFKDGIVAGLPAGIQVAHKWGFHETGPELKIKQLHDCGIVYFPEHPYLLCIMTSGGSYEYLDDAVREISRAVYTEIDHQQHVTETSSR